MLRETPKSFELILPTSPDFDPILGKQLVIVEQTELLLQQRRREWVKGLIWLSGVGITFLVSAALSGCLMPLAMLAMDIMVFTVLAVLSVAALWGLCYPFLKRGGNESPELQQTPPRDVEPHQDRRYSEYLELLASIKQRNEHAESLNGLACRLAHNQIPASLVAQARAGLAAMACQDDRLIEHIDYCRMLARQGPLGSIPAENEQRIRKAFRIGTQPQTTTDLDARLIAALEVAALDATKR